MHINKVYGIVGQAGWVLALKDSKNKVLITLHIPLIG